jgi:hypothetical protein
MFALVRSKPAARRRALSIAFLVLFGLAPLGAQEATTTETATAPTPKLPATDAADYLGAWVLHMESPQGAVDIDLEVADVGGNTVVSFEMPQLGAQTIDNITKTPDGGLELRYSLAFGAQSFNVVMTLLRDEGGLSGTMAEGNGLFSLPFTGESRQLAASPPDGDGRPARRGPSGATGTAELAVGTEKITLRFDRVPKTDAAYALVNEPVTGAIIPFLLHRPLKLLTPVDLDFGSAVVATHNISPTYPGVYGVWLRHDPDGWKLVFNHQADVWGTQHDPSEDAVVVALQPTSAPPTDTLEIQLVDAGEGRGVLTLTWGDHAWQAAFQAKGGS